MFREPGSTLTPEEKKIRFEKDNSHWLINCFENTIKCLSEDIAISKCYDDLKMAKKILAKLKERALVS